MLYIIVLVALILLVGYVTGRWLARELRGAAASARTAWRIRRGGRSPALLIEDTRAALFARALEPDCIVVSHEALELYDRLRARVIGQAAPPALPAAMVLALAIDGDARTCYLRAVETPPGQPGRETAACHELDRIARVEVVDHTGPAGLVATADRALEIEIDEPARVYRLALEPAWHVSAEDVAARLRRMLIEARKPAGAPVVVR
jgi:hypothetical protein